MVKFMVYLMSYSSCVTSATAPHLEVTSGSALLQKLSSSVQGCKLQFHLGISFCSRSWTSISLGHRFLLGISTCVLVPAICMWVAVGWMMMVHNCHAWISCERTQTVIHVITRIQLHNCYVWLHVDINYACHSCRHPWPQKMWNLQSQPGWTLATVGRHMGAGL